MNNKIEIPLKNGATLVAELYEYDSEHPEITVHIKDNSIITQDICLIRPSTSQDAHVECLVWGDEFDEDYTDRFLIPQYCEEE